MDLTQLVQKTKTLFFLAILILSFLGKPYAQHNEAVVIQKIESGEQLLSGDVKTLSHQSAI